MTTAQPKLLVIGDYCIDETIVVKPGKQNPENSSTLYSVVSTTQTPGMSGNVVACLTNLGFTTLTYLRSTSDPIKKTRIYCNYDVPVCRLDQDIDQEPINLSGLMLSKYDAVIISDYNKGAVTDGLIHQVLKGSRGPVFLDTKKTNLKDFEGCVVKINEHERNSAVSLPKNSLIVTLGEEGCIFDEKQYCTNTVPVVDVCGAGDAFLSGLVYGWLKHRDLSLSIPYGLANATISVQHLGCYGPTREELERSLQT